MIMENIVEEFEKWKAAPVNDKSMETICTLPTREHGASLLPYYYGFSTGERLAKTQVLEDMRLVLAKALSMSDVFDLIELNLSDLKAHKE